MRQQLLNYIDELNYSVTFLDENRYLAKQNRTDLSLELDFSYFGKTSLPKLTSFTADKKLFLLGIQDVEAMDFDLVSVFIEQLDRHCSLVVLESETFEQTMKEIWLFLSDDPRQRNVFTESKYYK